MNRCRYTEKQLKDAVEISFSIADVCRKLGLRPVGGNYGTIHDKIKKYNIDISHFTGQGWNVGDNYRPVMPPRPMGEILVLSDNPMKSDNLKRRLLTSGIKEAKCELCGRDKWRGAVIPIELHHINGNRHDNRLENLLILCPNCHAQTNNYRGRKDRGRKDRKKRRVAGNRKENTCVDCGTFINKKSTRCPLCYRKSLRKVRDRPSVRILKTEVNELGYCAVGRKYGVSDTAIRKWINNNAEVV